LEDFKYQIETLANEGWTVNSSNVYTNSSKVNYYALLQREVNPFPEVEVGWASGKE